MSGKTRKKTTRKRRTTKPLTARESIRRDQGQLVESISNQLDVFENKISHSNEQLWRNQNMLNTGLRTAEDHLILVRRVLNDALCGVTRVKTIERPEEIGSDEMETVQVIDWVWYTQQLDFCDSRDQYMSGWTLSEEEVERRIAAREEAIRLQRMDAIANRMLQSKNDEMRDAILDASELRDLLEKEFEGIELTDQDLADIIRISNEKIAAAPTPEEMEAEAKKLLDDTKKVADAAGEAIKTGDESKLDEVAETLEEAASLDSGGEEEQAKEEQQAAPPPADDGIPEGATVFGG